MLKARIFEFRPPFQNDPQSTTSGALVLILIVEDEPVIALDLAITLEQYGHQILGPVSRYEEVMRVLRFQQPELALVDINLHGVAAGIDIATTLQNDFDVPAIFLSGQQPQARDSREAALGLICKPVLAERVADCVNAFAQLRSGKTVKFPKELELFGGNDLDSRDRLPSTASRFFSAPKRRH